MSEALVIDVSIDACFDLTASLCVETALGIAVFFSVFLVMYQSVLLNSDSADFFTSLINTVLRPSVATSPSVPFPSLSS